MFEIRLICEPDDAEPITNALSRTFLIGPVRQTAARDSNHVRLYASAELPAAQQAPRSDRLPPAPDGTPYADAPSLLAEIDWLVDAALSGSFGRVLEREFWLRKAAMDDRIALADEREPGSGRATETAAEAEASAHRLAQFDQDHGSARGPVPPAEVKGASYRPYVRQEYALWRERTAESGADDQQRSGS
ncbi:hypothetical protein [Streptomyces armeniacus]|uniref:hypothetical protein n=1 Tax=Streptomyces armeniacus TaxID=83291 RepID=UPI001AD84EBD|nr:hypothetical protein [Streptomyces armeniacus]